MDADAVRDYLGGKVGAVEDYPFDAHLLVFKVRGKMFALMALNKSPAHVTLKCDPEEAEALRAAFRAIRPSDYMHKAHWSTVILDRTVPDDLLQGMLDGSHALVVQKLKKFEQAALQAGSTEEQ